MSERLIIESSRFGRVEADAREAIRFPGLPGFPQARRFLVRQHDRGSVFAWLLSVDVPDLAFVITNPWHFFPHYAPRIEPRWLEHLGTADPEDVEIVALVSVGPEAMFLNLAAPLLIHPQTRRGVQVILDAPDCPARAAVACDPAAAAPRAAPDDPRPAASRE